MNRSEKALRRMVSRLPSMPKSDFDSIMETLSSDQQSSVVTLLAELQNGSSKARSVDQLKVSHEPLVMPANLSEWLAARVNNKQAAGDEEAVHFSMTAHAVAALRLCAAELTPQPPLELKRVSFFEKLWRRVASDRFAV